MDTLELQTIRPLINGLAGLFFAVLAAEAVYRRRVRFGRRVPAATRAERPRLYWVVVGAYCIVAIWTGLAATFQR